MTARMVIPTVESLPAPPPGRSGWPWTEAPPPLPPRRAGGEAWPRISIVTGSHNQAEYLEETLRSVLLQGYPDLEYIVIDGGSSDDSLGVIRRYAPWLARWEAQADRGQAAMLNSGFEQASGAILGFLNSDDTYLPGALARVAQEVDAERHRHLVVGRCLFVDAAGRPLGREHTSRAVSHHRHLAVWKGNTIPQPAAFWSRAAWVAGGPLGEEAGQPWIDYGLFCRITRLHRVHAVDQIFATYRLHPRSITSTSAHRSGEAAVPISRRYWGPVWTPRHLSLAASLAIHRFDRLARARAAVRRSREQRAQGQSVRAFALTASIALLAPDLLLRLAAERRQGNRLHRSLAKTWAGGSPSGIAVDGERPTPWHDRWAGPYLRLDIAATGGERHLRLEGTRVRPYLGAPLRLRVRVDGKTATVKIDADGPFAVDIPLPQPLVPGRTQLEIASAPYFVPDTILGNHDQRHLCWLFQAAHPRP